MHADCKLTVVGWLHVVVGTAALVEQIVSLCVPVEQRRFHIYILAPSVNLAVLWLPVGIGLLRHSAWCHRAAIIINWLVVTMIAVTLVFLAAAPLLGEWEWRPKKPVSGGDYRDLFVFLVIAPPLFVWQFRTLRSSSVRRIIDN